MDDFLKKRMRVLCLWENVVVDKANRSNEFGKLNF